MNRYILLMAGCALYALGPTAAHADCQSELAAFEAGQVPNTGGVAKDGSLAPLQDPASRAGQTTAPGASGSATTGATADGAAQEAAPDGKIAKDGSTAPLGADAKQAMSGQDAQAQQAGDKTAAEQSQDGAASTEVTPERAIAEAKAALLAGNEEACLAALRKIGGT